MDFINVPISNIVRYRMGEANPRVSKPRVRFIKSWRISSTTVSCIDWQTVKVWANNNGYTIRGGLLTAEQKPIVGVNWFDAILWCNAASELYSLEPVYRINNIPIRGSQQVKRLKNKLDMPRPRYLKAATGFRLPTEAQWEFCATINGTLSSDTYLSHQYANIPCSDAACTYCTATPLLTDIDGNTYRDKVLEEVKSRDPSSRGLYHMVGNTLEWVFDDYDTTAYIDNQDGEDPSFFERFGQYEKVLKGAAYGISDTNMVASDRVCCNATFRLPHVSFRIVRPIIA